MRMACREGPEDPERSGARGNPGARRPSAGNTLNRYSASQREANGAEGEQHTR